MADYRIKLSDGVDTIDLYGGSDSQVRDAGFSLLPPNAITSFIGNPTFDGERLGRARYGNRTISLTIKIVGTTVSDLKDNIRTVQRLLNDAKERSLLGYGSQVFLEYQWGDTINDSVFYDVIRGDLVLPRGFQTATMSVGFTVLDAQLNLICKPFGRYIEQDIATDTLENSQSAHLIKESFLTGEDAIHEIHGDNWEAQTFTTTSAFTVKKAAFPVDAKGTPPSSYTVAIYATSGSLPTGSALCSGIVNPNEYILRERVEAENPSLKADFGAGYALDDATEYALVVYDTAGTGDVDNCIRWQVDIGAGYATGQRAFSINDGVGWTADASDDFLFAILAEETKANYQDITTAAAYGDAPAKLYHRLSQTGATGTEKIWVAKRSGLRQADDLWIEGEDWSSLTDINATIMTLGNWAESGISGGLAGYCYHHEAVAANIEIARLNYTINTIPRGQFRILAKCKVVCEDADDFDHLSFGAGWSYGDKTKTPTEANEEYYQCAADSAWEVLDLGVLNIPPIAESDMAISNNFELRIYLYVTEALTAGEHYEWFLDFIFLLPIDEGVVIIDDVATTDVIAVDGITDPPNVFILSATNVIEDFPDYVGNPFALGRESTRLYVLRDDAKTMTFSSNVKYQPRFMVA